MSHRRFETILHGEVPLRTLQSLLILVEGFLRTFADGLEHAASAANRLTQRRRDVNWNSKRAESVRVAASLHCASDNNFHRCRWSYQGNVSAPDQPGCSARS